jgi:hypothetical protein
MRRAQTMVTEALMKPCLHPITIRINRFISRREAPIGDHLINIRDHKTFGHLLRLMLADLGTNLGGQNNNEDSS